MTKIFSTTAIAAILSASVASAGGLSAPVVEEVAVPAPVAPVMASNDWTGFYVGGQVGTGTATLTDGEDELEADLTNYGLHAGYLADLGTFVLGGEIDYDVLDIDDAEDDADNSVIRGKAIAGYDLGALLPYATAGIASASLEGFDDRENGYFYGVGAAYQVTDSIRIGGEALAHKFSDVGADDSGVDLDVNTFSLKASFTF